MMDNVTERAAAALEEAPSAREAIERVEDAIQKAKQPERSQLVRVRQEVVRQAAKDPKLRRGLL